MNYIKRMQQKGATMVEYAILLAFVAVIAVSFINGSISKPIEGIVHNVNGILYSANSPNKVKGEAMEKLFSYFSSNITEGTKGYMSTGMASATGLRDSYQNSNDIYQAALKDAGLSNGIEGENIQWTKANGSSVLYWSAQSPSNMNTGDSINVIAYDGTSYYAYTGKVSEQTIYTNDGSSFKQIDPTRTTQMGTAYSSYNDALMAYDKL